MKADKDAIRKGPDMLEAYFRKITAEKFVGIRSWDVSLRVSVSYRALLLAEVGSFITTRLVETLIKCLVWKCNVSSYLTVCLL